jgi:arylsulfatase A-like enzyme
LGSLADLGQLDDTLVVVTSDHGEAFGERGFEGHARKVYRETTEVPWLIFFPFRLEPGLVVETRTRNVDVWPTVLDLLGLELPQADGRSRRPEILANARGEAPAEDADPAIAHLDQSWARAELDPAPTVAVSEGRWRYVRVQQANGVVEQLYDASGDPRELRDLAREDPETLERLAGVAETYLEQRPDWGEAPTREIGELELNHLRALGYAVP